MLFRETVDVYCENHMENTDTLCGQNSEFWYVKVRGIQRNHLSVNGELIKLTSFQSYVR
jgi:hypothetical protein